AKDLKGDFLECGVLKGFSSYLLRSLEDQLFKDTINNYFLIDSFEGLSDFLDEDKSLNPDIIQNKKGDLKANIEDVKVLFNQFKNVNIIKGWIPKVFESLDEKNKYKFVHIDVDLYQPTFDSLNYIYDKIVEGGILITDDYRSPSFPGNQKAWEKYFNSKNIRSLSLPSGQAVVIKE
ncbi:MAG: class I SAM-dependent methyltransferase, partial [Pelagibacteraceae bacterium]|nr:class I SAM-dependent methyltransferase [Pelagibacteraceae bacterium]